MDVECLAKFEQHILGHIFRLDYAIMVFDILLGPLLLRMATTKL